MLTLRICVLYQADKMCLNSATGVVWFPSYFTEVMKESLTKKCQLFSRVTLQMPKSLNVKDGNVSTTLQIGVEQMLVATRPSFLSHLSE